MTAPRKKAAKKAAKKATRPQAPLPQRVFQALADGKFHSGEELAARLEVSRSAVWKAAGALEALGVPLEAVRNRGYRLTHTGGALAAEKIRALLGPEVRSRVKKLETAWSLASTNTALLSRPNPKPAECEVLLAEHQTAGRGRRGRSWLAAPGGALCLSLSWTFREVPQDLGALGLVVGVCVRRALAGLGVGGLGLKWPNDLLLDGRKLGGILIELRAESSGPACVVIGIGLNVVLGEDVIREIAASGIEATDLAAAGLTGPQRNRIAASVIRECVQGLIRFEREALRPFIEDWRAADAMAGRPVSVSGAQAVAHGIARGIDLHGAFLLETPAGVERFLAGDVTLRSA